MLQYFVIADQSKESQYFFRWTAFWGVVVYSMLYSLVKSHIIQVLTLVMRGSVEIDLGINVDAKINVFG